MQLVVVLSGASQPFGLLWSQLSNPEVQLPSWQTPELHTPVAWAYVHAIAQVPQ